MNRLNIVVEHLMFRQNSLPKEPTRVATSTSSFRVDDEKNAKPFCTEMRPADSTRASALALALAFSEILRRQAGVAGKTEKQLRKITIRRRGGDKAREMEQKKIRGSRQHQVPSTRPESTRRLQDGGFYFRKRTQTTTYADFASSEDILAEPPFPSLTGLHETQASLSPGQNAAPAQSLHAKNRTQKHARLRSLRPKVARLSETKTNTIFRPSLKTKSKIAPRLCYTPPPLPSFKRVRRRKGADQATRTWRAWHGRETRCSWGRQANTDNVKRCDEHKIDKHRSTIITRRVRPELHELHTLEPTDAA